jgi:hypothetical protein
MARPSQQRKRRIAAPEPADTEPALPQDVGVAGDDGGENALVVELSDIGQAELALAGEVSSEPLHGLHLVGGDERAALPSPVMLSSAAAPLVAGAVGSEAELAGTAIEGKLRGNLDYADWSGIKGWI